MPAPLGPCACRAAIDWLKHAARAPVASAGCIRAERVICGTAQPNNWTCPLRMPHPNADGTVQYSPRPGRGKMDFGYQVVRLGERPAEQLLAGELGLAPLAMLGQLSEGATVEDGLAAVAQRLVQRLTQEAEPARATKPLTSALLLTGLRVDRHVAGNIFRGVHMLEESDTYLMILEQGEERARREAILMVGEERFGAANESVRDQLANVVDPERLKRMVRKAAMAANWQEILDTP